MLSERIVSMLQEKGLLLQQDRALPSVVGIVTGESLRSSWWGHPKAHVVFAVLSELADHHDVLFTKLLSGKVTLVHRRLWPALLTVGRSRDAWQLDSLSRGARRALREVDEGSSSVVASGAVARELESRLLVVAREVHSAEGRHELVLQGWRPWSRRAGCRRVRSAGQARTMLESAASRLGAPAGALPWAARRAAT